MGRRSLGGGAALLGETHRWGIAAVHHGGGAIPITLYRYRLPSTLSWAGSPGRLEIPLDKATTAVGFAYGQGGWHPHVETLRRLRGAGSDGADPGDSPLARLYAAFQPTTVREAIFDDFDDPLAGFTDVPLVRGQLRELWNPYGERTTVAAASLDRPGLYWGPAPDEYVASEVERTLKVYDGLVRSGLQDDGFGKEAVSGYLLVRGDDYRFVVHQGHHRLACLTALGETSVPVYLTPKAPPVVDERRLQRWTEGRRARYSASAGRLLFTRMFESTGVDKARRLGLLPGADHRVRER